MEVVKFFEERKRYINSIGGTNGSCREVNCKKCIFWMENNKTGMPCNDFIINYAEEAEALLQKWIDEHPQKTRQDIFLEQYPNAQLDERGIIDICPKLLDDSTKCEGICVVCKAKYWLEEV